MDGAIATLSKGKAMGVDKLADLLLHKHKKTIQDKLLSLFNDWNLRGFVPSYFKTSRIVVFSKEDTAYPSVGACRIIAI